MKKIITISLTIIIFISTCITASATETMNNTHEIGNVTVIFDANSSFDTKKQEYIANYIVSPDYGVSTAGLLCTLFGHKNTSETVITITHKVRDTDPRCYEETFAVTSCSRCDETSTVRTAFKYITCCPEE